MPFFHNIIRADTWSIAADLNHIVHPLSKPTEAQIDHKEPCLTDRIGGSVLFALSMLLVIPACLYLYWASKKVDQIDHPKPDSSEAKADQIANKASLFRTKTEGKQDATPQVGQKTTANPKTAATTAGKPNTAEGQDPKSKLDAVNPAALQPILDYTPGYDLPVATWKSFNEIFGNAAVVEQIPLHNGNTLPYESLTFPIMKGITWTKVPYIVIRIVPADPEAHFEKYEKAQAEKIAAECGANPRSGKSKEEVFKELKEKALIRIREGELVTLSKVDANPQFLAWEEELKGGGDVFSGFFNYKKPNDPFLHTTLTDSKTGKVLDEVKPRLALFHEFIATGSVKDPETNEVWNIRDYEKVKQLLNPTLEKAPDEKAKVDAKGHKKTTQEATPKNTDETAQPLAFSLPQNTRTGFNTLFNNDKILDRIPFCSLEKRKTYYLNAKCFDEPIMKGVTQEDMQNPGAAYLVVKVLPVDPEAYFNRYERVRCASYSNDTWRHNVEELWDDETDSLYQTEEQVYAYYKGMDIEKIKNKERLILIEQLNGGISSLAWGQIIAKDDSGSEGYPNFFNTDESSHIIDNTGELTKGAEKLAGPFQDLIRKGVGKDVWGIEWKIVDFEKVKKITETPSFHIGNGPLEGFRLEIVEGDLLAQEVDAIVNPANTSLNGGGGVDGKIEAKAGRSIYQECQTQLKEKGLKSAKTGDAYITGPGNLAHVKHVIHAIGPKGDKPNREKLLESAYYESLLRAHENNLESIAFPAISIGIFGYPAEEAPKEIWTAVTRFQGKFPNSSLKTVRLVYWTGTEKDRTSHAKMLEWAEEKSLIR